MIVGGTDGLGKWSALNVSLPGRIFISYRRQETGWPARQLYDVLVNHFPPEQVFKDVDNIDPGDDFIERIAAAVGSCDVLLVLIGPRWLTISDENGHRRLDDPEDWVRVEIETALTRKIRVIPILVDEAKMPGANALPPTLAPLVRRNAVEINPVTFDTKRLMATVHKTLEQEFARQQAEEQVRREADQQAKRQADQQAKRQAEEQAQRQADQQAKRQAEEQAQRQAEEQAQRQAEEQAQRQAEEQAQRQAEAEQQARRQHKEAEDRARRLRKEQRRRNTQQLLRNLRQRVARPLSRRWVVVLSVGVGIGVVLLSIYVSRPPIMGELPAYLRASCSASTDTSATCRTDGTVVLYRLFDTATEARADVVKGNEPAPDGTPCPPSAPHPETPVVCSYEASAETGVAAFSQTVERAVRFYEVRWSPDAHSRLRGTMTTKNNTPQDWESLRSNWMRLAEMD